MVTIHHPWLIGMRCLCMGKMWGRCRQVVRRVCRCVQVYHCLCVALLPLTHALDVPVFVLVAFTRSTDGICEDQNSIEKAHAQPRQVHTMILDQTMPQYAALLRGVVKTKRLFVRRSGESDSLARHNLDQQLWSSLRAIDEFESASVEASHSSNTHSISNITPYHNFIHERADKSGSCRAEDAFCQVHFALVKFSPRHSHHAEQTGEAKQRMRAETTWLAAERLVRGTVRKHPSRVDRQDIAEKEDLHTSHLSLSEDS